MPQLAADDLSNIIATAALLFSLLSLYVSWRAQELTERQEKRRELKLRPSLLNGYFRNERNGRGRVYAFYLSVSNPADADNAVAALDLHLTYVTKAKLLMTVKLGSEATALGLGNDSTRGAPLVVPTRIAAHDTISGWCRFTVDASIIEGVQVEAHKIVLSDTHGVETSVDPIIVQEYRDEIQPAPN